MDEINRTNNCSSFNFNITLIANKEDRDSAMDFLKTFYFRDEPLNSSIELIKETESVIKLENFCDTYLLNGISLMAVSENGEIIGVILNSKTCRNSSNKYVVDDNNKESSKYNEIMIFLEKTQREIDIYGKYPTVDSIMNISIISVNDKYRGRSVCKSLIAKTKEMAHELGCQMVAIECSSHFTVKAVERFGFKCIYSLNYLDYVNL